VHHHPYNDVPAVILLKDQTDESLMGQGLNFGKVRHHS